MYKAFEDRRSNLSVSVEASSYIKGLFILINVGLGLGLEPLKCDGDSSDCVKYRFDLYNIDCYLNLFVRSGE